MKLKDWEVNVHLNIKQIVSRYRNNYYIINQSIETIPEYDVPTEEIREADMKVSARTRSHHKKITYGWDNNVEFKTNIENGIYKLMEEVKAAAAEIWKTSDQVISEILAMPIGEVRIGLAKQQPLLD